jgi:ATP-dependent exoDNAse (exonuclease V) alpha subunit
MAKYNINDPTDVAIMNSLFDGYSEEDWEQYEQLAKEKHFGYDDIGKLKNAKKNTRRSKFLTSKQIAVILALVEKLDEIEADDERNDEAAELIESDDFDMPVSHATFRVAWHDNKWNGCICKEPEDNTYCNGFNSLLSERIRKRKDENMTQEIANKGKSLKEIDYLPPCFWSTNLFGNEQIKVKHDNPAAPDLLPIEEKLPANSILSWPFSISFTRTDLERKNSGAYPQNLEEVRIPRFNAKLHEGKSIAFMYAKYSNPITEEEQQYLVVGAGVIDKKVKASDIRHFGPESEIEKIKARPKSNYKYRNFPSINWAMRFSFDNYSTVRMPYHEYLAAAEKLDDESKDGFLDNIKVAITEPELEWCFKYVAMDIGDDEAIYILTKMRMSLIKCTDDGIVARDEMRSRIEIVDRLLELAWSSRTYFPGFVNLSRVILKQQYEPKFELETFYLDIKEEKDAEKELGEILHFPANNPISKIYHSQIKDLTDRLNQRNLSIEQFLKLSMLNLRTFQFERILDGKLKLPGNWIRDFDKDVKRSHNTIDIINNPYLLCEDYEYWPDSHDNVYGEELDSNIDLFKIDIAYFPHSRFKSRIDLQCNMSYIDKRRVRALVIRHLETLENTGHCFTDAHNLQEAISSYPLFYEIGSEYDLPENFFFPIKSEYSNHFQDEPKKLVLVEANDTIYYYLAKVFNAEKNIEKKITTLLRASDHKEQYLLLADHINKSVIKLRKTIGDYFDEEGFRNERESLYKNLFAKRFFIVAGSAGSGKSYEILNIISNIKSEAKQKYLLLAPTGKAALRLSNDLDFKGITASTIDKFIVDVRNGKISASELTQYKNIIIDETSMVDLLKFNSLLELFNFKDNSFKRLILIGDPNQLPAIGYGRILEDIISFLRTHKQYHNNFIQLETNCRSELKENEVLKLAEAFKKEGEFDLDLLLKFKRKETEISDGFKTRYWSNKDELYVQIQDEFDLLASKENFKGNTNSKLNQLLGLSEGGEILKKKMGIENFQILSPYNSQYSGTNKINDFIQTKFKNGLKFEFRKHQYKKADKLIRTKNYYENKNLVLSNGTMGFVLDKANEAFYYESANGISIIPFYDIRKNEQEFFELAYAISVHKSQGSGFNHLFLVLPARYGLLSKELVYTALTRTKKSITLFLQTNEERNQNILEIAQSRSYSASRWTSLMLDKPFRFYDLEPEPGVFVESRVELLIYHLLMKKRNELGVGLFNFDYEKKPVINGDEINIKTDFTLYCNGNIWYWEHLGLLGQRKYNWTWKNLKKNTYQEAGIWDNVITTDETNGINPSKIESLINIIIQGKVEAEDKHNQYSNHHYYIR